jgi:uncharacterized UPF0160 family protein
MLVGYLILNKNDLIIIKSRFFSLTIILFICVCRTFTDTFHSLQPNKPWTIKLSSAGLIYVHFGREIIRELLNKENLDENVKDHLTEILFDKLYEKFVQEIDAIDNGIDISENMK